MSVSLSVRFYFRTVEFIFLLGSVQISAAAAAASCIFSLFLKMCIIGVVHVLEDLAQVQGHFILYFYRENKFYALVVSL